MSEVTYQGGCLCGSIRYEARGKAERPHTCSCSMCRKSTGGVVSFWIEFDAANVAWTGPGGEPATYRSSHGSRRAFCPVCGSSVGAIDDEPVIALLVGTLDDVSNADLAPDYHAFASERPTWLATVCEQLTRNSD